MTDLQCRGLERQETGPPRAASRLPSRPIARTGDLWLLGRHRLLCGDSTDADAVARVMEGERASLLFTSPPYAHKRNYTTDGIGDWDALMRGVFRHLDLVMTADGQVLVNLGLVHYQHEWHPYWDGWLEWMRAQGWRRFGLYVWDQGPGLPGEWHGRLAPAFELLFHFNRKARKPNKIVPCKWAGDINDSPTCLRLRDGTLDTWSHFGRPVQESRIPDNVLRIMRHKSRGVEVAHPAVFPVELPEFIMRAYSSPNELVFEPFSGSGTTIIAGERAGRRVRAIEIAPQYVDIALLRWREFHRGATLLPDFEPRLADGGTLSEIADARGVDLPRLGNAP